MKSLRILGVRRVVKKNATSSTSGLIIVIISLSSLIEKKKCKFNMTKFKSDSNFRDATNKIIRFNLIGCLYRVHLPNLWQ